MLRGPLSAPKFRGQFSGHETFPLRYGWLNKVYDRVADTQKKKNQNLFRSEDAIISFGVGRNMVSAIRYWGLAAGIIEEKKDGGYVTTPFSDRLLGPNGVDPFLENPASLWLIHWRLASTPERTTTWFWAFNHYAGRTFDRDTFTDELVKLCQQYKWERAAPASIYRDVDCFIRTYVHAARAGELTEDFLESPLAELRLIQPTGHRGGYEFNYGLKQTLPDEIFNFALAEFWDRHTKNKSLALEAITYEPGSPGRVFKLDEESVAQRLSRIEHTSSGAFQWTDTAGVRQVLQKKVLRTPLSLIRSAFTARANRRQAAE